MFTRPARTIAALDAAQRKGSRRNASDGSPCQESGWFDLREGGGDRRELLGDLGAEHGQGHGADDGDQRQQQAVLRHRRALFLVPVLPALGTGHDLEDTVVDEVHDVPFSFFSHTYWYAIPDGDGRSLQPVLALIHR